MPFNVKWTILPTLNHAFKSKSRKVRSRTSFVSSNNRICSFVKTVISVESYNRNILNIRRLSFGQWYFQNSVKEVTDYANNCTWRRRNIVLNCYNIRFRYILQLIISKHSRTVIIIYTYEWYLMKDFYIPSKSKCEYPSDNPRHFPSL